MQRHQLNIIKKLARQAREWAVQNAKYFPCDLTGFCGISSVNVFLLLKQHGFFPKIATSYIHAFVICNEYIVDVTASQFREPEICVIKHNRVNQDFWSIDDIYHNVEQFMESQEDHWCKSQWASHYKDKFIVPM